MPAVIRKVRYLTDRIQDGQASRDEIWAHNFRHVWLRLALGAAEYAAVKDFSLLLLRELYPGIWLNGPHWALWRERKDLLLLRLDQLQAGGVWEPAEVLEFHRRVYVAFCEQGRVHGGTINAFASRYHRSMLPGSNSVISIFKVARHRYWTSPETQTFERDVNVIGEGQSYWPGAVANFMHRSTLGMWLLAEMGERSMHARKLLRLHEDFWVWLAATNRPTG